MDSEIFDSGMASLDDSSKDATPEKPKAIVGDDDAYDEDIEDETWAERLEGLTEMLPDSVRNFSSKVASMTTASIKGLYNFSRSGLWIVASSSLLLFGPLVFEVERAQLEESQRSQQKQFLLGPNTMSGNLGPNMAMTSR
ncbi:mitochondrial import receptor subunit TOM22 homolog [Macrosteles quadrilineatus]|uniref:mitochondrial import receptor subunit TOM22 homolog n=1 Tax=Macrosteles quadrilineatus TaxID=74068 RepID=UPI0023E115C4|nr:mitochondrial import receptor subunit TOM22 homolog [Macrosteles quadrilineatus]